MNPYLYIRSELKANRKLKLLQEFDNLEHKAFRNHKADSIWAFSIPEYEVMSGHIQEHEWRAVQTMIIAKKLELL